VKVRHNYAFIVSDHVHMYVIILKSFLHIRDAQDAVFCMDGKMVQGTRIKVQFQGKQLYNCPKLVGQKRNRGPTNEDICYNCGKSGHW